MAGVNRSGAMPGVSVDENGKIPASVMPISTGTGTPNGDNVTLTFAFAHGLGATPSWVGVSPRNLRSCGDFFCTWDATNITVTYLVAPTAGALSLSFIAVM